MLRVAKCTQVRNTPAVSGTRGRRSCNGQYLVSTRREAVSVAFIRTHDPSQRPVSISYQATKALKSPHPPAALLGFGWETY